MTREQQARLEELQMQADYHRDRHRLYQARFQSSRPTSPARLRELRRARDVAEARLRDAMRAATLRSASDSLRGTSPPPGDPGRGG